MLLRNGRFTMHKLISILIALSLLGAVAQAQEQKKFRAAIILPLTGTLAQYGVATKNGFDLAQRENPETFRNIEFVYEDSKYDNMTAVSIYRNHKASGDVSLFYAWGYGICQVLAPIAESEHAPLIAASAERSVSANRNYVLRFNYYHRQAAEALLSYLRSKGLKHLALVKADIAYMDGILAGLRDLLKSDESIEIVDAFSADDMDFRTAISKLKTKTFDALGVFLTGPQGSQFYKQMRLQRLNPVTFATDFFDSDTVAEESDGAMDGVVFAAQEANSGFRERYKRAYGNDFHAVWAAHGYEFAHLVAQLFGQGDQGLSPAEVMQRFRTANVAPKGAARYSFNDTAEGPGFDFAVTLRRIEGNKTLDLVTKP